MDVLSGGDRPHKYLECYFSVSKSHKQCVFVRWLNIATGECVSNMNTKGKSLETDFQYIKAVNDMDNASFFL